MWAACMHVFDLPHLSSFFSALAGDEICCGGTPYNDLAKVAAALKAGLPAAWIYTNECSEMAKWPKLDASGNGGVPPGLDAVSVDFYDEHNTDGAAEVEKNKKFYNEEIFPRLRSVAPCQAAAVLPSSQLMLVNRKPVPVAAMRLLWAFLILMGSFHSICQTLSARYANESPEYVLLPESRCHCRPQAASASAVCPGDFRELAVALHVAGPPSPCWALR